MVYNISISLALDALLLFTTTVTTDYYSLLLLCLYVLWYG